MSEYHTPVLLKESVDALEIKDGGIYVDATLGGGGHTREILSRMGPSSRLVVFDQDSDAIENAPKDSRIITVHNNFRFIANFIRYHKIDKVDGILADLGVSSHQFDTPERGFSFRFEAPLDMRMNQQAGRTAADIVNSYDEESLARVLYIFGEMKNARQVARRIVKARSTNPIATTEQFAEICQVPKKDLAQLFQALRIEVNDEMGALREMLEGALQLLKPGGRLAILTYHSLEDRMVKNFLRAGNIEGTIEKDFYGNALTPFRVIEKGRQATPEEVERNPRSRSARLRIGEKK